MDRKTKGQYRFPARADKNKAEPERIDMRLWATPFTLSIVLLSLSALDVATIAEITAAQASDIKPPVAKRQAAKLTVHGMQRTDNYGWLRDANWRQVVQDPLRLAPEINDHITAENAYAEALLQPLAPLRTELIEELKGRIVQDDSGVPQRDGPFAYWRKFVPGAEHPRLMRSRADGTSEEVLLDGAALAAGKSYFSFGSFHHSPDHRLYAYMVDETGSESFQLHILDIGARRNLPEVISKVTDFAWARDNKTLFYVRHDDDHRARFVYRHRLGTDPAKDPLVYKERDLGFEVSVSLTRSGRFVAIETGSSETSEAYLIDAARPNGAPVLVAKRKPNLRYYVDDWGDQLVIRTNADGAEDFKVVTAPLTAPGPRNWRELLPIGKVARSSGPCRSPTISRRSNAKTAWSAWSSAANRMEFRTRSPSTRKPMTSTLQAPMNSRQTRCDLPIRLRQRRNASSTTTWRAVRARYARSRRSRAGMSRPTTLFVVCQSPRQTTKKYRSRYCTGKA